MAFYNVNPPKYVRRYKGFGDDAVSTSIPVQVNTVVDSSVVNTPTTMEQLNTASHNLIDVSHDLLNYRNINTTVDLTDIFKQLAILNGNIQTAMSSTTLAESEVLNLIDQVNAFVMKADAAMI